MPDRPGYHLSDDLVDEAITQIRDLRGLAPAKPFFLYLGFSAGHAPHQARREWIERYRSAFDHGWDEERVQILERQIRLGIFPPGTEHGESNPGVADWAALSATQRQVFARMMEVYAGFISHTDAQIGRLLDVLDQVGATPDTVVMLLSDNGASAEGGPEGSLDSHAPADAPAMVPHLEELGGSTFYNHYPWGWAQAGNTPFRWYKQFTHAGGITNGLLVRWPREVPAGDIRRQYHHVIDITPTLLDIAGVSPPQTVDGVTQQPLHGVSMRSSFREADAAGSRDTQHYEMWGNRGLWALAGRYDVLPVDDRPRRERWPVDPPPPEGADPRKTTFCPGGPYEPSIAPRLSGRSFAIEAEAEVADDRAFGVLYAFGGRHGGYCWYLDDGQVHLEAARASVDAETVSAPIALGPGTHTVALILEGNADDQARVRFWLDGEPVAERKLWAMGVPAAGRLSPHPRRSRAVRNSRPAVPSAIRLQRDDPAHYGSARLAGRITVRLDSPDTIGSLEEELAAELRER